MVRIQNKYWYLHNFYRLYMHNVFKKIGSSKIASGDKKHHGPFLQTKFLEQHRD